jgi:hypothetical protein
MYYDTLKGSGLKAVLRSTCSTAMAKFVGNATVVLDGGERAEQAREALAEHKAMYVKAFAELQKHKPSKFDEPNSLESMLDFMIHGREIKEADIQRLVGMGVSEEEARRVLGQGATTNVKLQGLREPIIELWGSTEPADEPSLSVRVYYDYAVRAAKALAQARDRAIRLAGTGKRIPESVIADMLTSTTALINWAQEFEQDEEVQQWLEEQDGKGYPVERVADQFPV